MGPLNQNPRLQSAPPSPFQPLHLLLPPALLQEEEDTKEQGFLLIMNHSSRAGPGQGVPGAQSLTWEVAGRLELLIKGPGCFQKGLIQSQAVETDRQTDTDTHNHVDYQWTARGRGLGLHGKGFPDVPHAN